jgi:hypothetical protein
VSRIENGAGQFDVLSQIVERKPKLSLINSDNRKLRHHLDAWESGTPWCGGIVVITHPCYFIPGKHGNPVPVLVNESVFAEKDAGSHPAEGVSRKLPTKPDTDRQHQSLEHLDAYVVLYKNHPK